MRQVAVFREYFLPRSETFIRDHLLHLPRWQPTAVTPNRLPDALEVPGVDVIDAWAARSLVTRARTSMQRRRGTDDGQVLDLAIRDALRRARADVVHAHFGTDAAVAFPAVRRAGLPMVVTFHGYDATMHPEFLRESESGALMLDRWDELTSYASIIAVSGFIRDELIRRGVDADRIEVIPCMVITADLPWSPPPPDGGILFVGRLVEKKGCSDLLDAVSRMSCRPTVRIIGDGPLREELEDKAQRNGVDAEFLGVRTSTEVRDALSACSVVALPSKRAQNGDCEGLPVFSLEASAMGRPVVGYAHSGLVESVVSGQTGLLSDEGDVVALAADLERVLRDQDELLRLATNARSHVERHFELADGLARVETVYEDALRRGATNGAAGRGRGHPRRPAAG